MTAATKQDRQELLALEDKLNQSRVEMKTLEAQLMGAVSGFTVTRLTFVCDAAHNLAQQRVSRASRPLGSPVAMAFSDA